MPSTVSTAVLQLVRPIHRRPPPPVQQPPDLQAVRTIVQDRIASCVSCFGPGYLQCSDGIRCCALRGYHYTRFPLTGCRQCRRPKLRYLSRWQWKVEVEQRPARPSMAQVVSPVAETRAIILVKARSVALTANIALADRHVLLLSANAATRYVLVHCCKSILLTIIGFCKLRLHRLLCASDFQLVRRIYCNVLQLQLFLLRILVLHLRNDYRE